MSPSSSSRSSKPKPSEVAAETKKFLKKIAATWPAYSYLFSTPLAITQDQLPPRPMMNLNPPSFCEFIVQQSQRPSTLLSILDARYLYKVSRHCSTNTLDQMSVMVTLWTLQRAGQMRTTTLPLHSSVLPTRSDLAGTGRRVCRATRNACADGATCHHTCPTQRRTIPYRLRVDYTQAVSVGTLCGSSPTNSCIPIPLQLNGLD